MDSLKQATHLEIGKFGEQFALEYLKAQGYRIVAINFIARLGRSLKGRPLTGEIDIIAFNLEWLCFIEVKTRRSDWFAPPEQAVDLHKQRQIARTAYRFRQLFSLMDEPYRFDVVAIVLGNDLQPSIELKPGFFDEKSLKKRAYCWQRSVF
jgi:putative endonuclease